MLYHQGASSELIGEYSARAEKSYVLKHLIGLRHRHEKTQKEVAVGMGCTQSRLSKIESNTDEELTVDQLKRYAGTLGYCVVLNVIPNSGRASDQVHFYGCEIDRIIQRLAARSHAETAVVPSFTEGLHQLSLMLETDERPPRSLPYLEMRVAENVALSRTCPKCGPASLPETCLSLP
jgi:transcriptional regulator with XRE-family HTH domain